MKKSYLEENDNFDYSSKNIQDLVKTIEELNKLDNLNDYAIQAYYYIRDHWMYNPYKLSLDLNDWKASNITEQKSGNCLDKAIILISVLRAKGIPARLGIAKVVNHIAIEDMIEKFGSSELVPHGYVDMYLDEKWVKATPAFNESLCKKLNVQTLEFNGKEDSLFQEYDNTGEVKFMEYIEDYGTFDHVPLEFMIELLTTHYPAFSKNNLGLGSVINLETLK